MKQSTKDNYWKILNNHLTLPETMELFGIEKPDSDKIIEEIKTKDKHDSSNYFALVSILKHEAYARLVGMKEIDDTKVFNLSKHKYDNQDARHGDIGLMGNKTYVYTKGRWVSFS